MARRVSAIWVWNGDPEFGRATRRAEGLAGSSCATVQGIELIQRVNRPHGNPGYFTKWLGAGSLNSLDAKTHNQRQRRLRARVRLCA